MSIFQALDLLRAAPPDMTVTAFLASLDRFIAHAECRYCHQPISRFEIADDQPWVHNDTEHARGCRPASYQPGEGWNNRLDKGWKATPKLNSVH